MNSFTYQYPVKNYFGEGALHTALAAELPAMGEKVMLAYGGGSIKRTGLYDEIVAALQDAGKTVVEFPGIMPNPTYEKVQEGARIAREEGVDFILAVGGGVRLLQDRLRSGAARRGHRRFRARAGQDADRLHPAGVRGHALRHRRRAEQRRRHH